MFTTLLEDPAHTNRKIIVRDNRILCGKPERGKTIWSNLVERDLLYN